MEYADTSFLVSLHVADSNHTRAVAHASTWTTPPHLPFTPFGAFELNNTLRQLLYRGTLQPDDATFVASRITRNLARGILEERPLEAYRLIDSANRVSQQLTARTGTRALDLLHVALAQMHGARVFLTFDRNQGRTAALAGMTVAP
jgi:predicted nucleic acid-binding protein